MLWPCMPLSTIIFVSLVLISALFISAVAQSSPSGSTPLASPASGPSGTATVENQMLTYDAMAMISERIADRLAAKICPLDNPGNTKSCENHGESPKNSPSLHCQCNTDHQLLLQDNNTLTLQTAASSFTLTADRLAEAYTNVCTSTLAPLLAPLPTGLGGSDISSLLGAIKSSATITNQTFQPDQRLAGQSFHCLFD